MRFAAILLVAFACSGAFASEPGQPLDCSDWVFLEPGLSCNSVIPRGSCAPIFTGAGNIMCNLGEKSAVDNDSNVLSLEGGPTTPCPGGNISNGGVLQLVRYVGGVREVLAYLAGRCVSPTRVDYISVQYSGFLFDAMRGRVLITTATSCYEYPNSGSCPADYDSDGMPDSVDPNNDANRQVMAINGLTTVFNVLQTYTPQASLGFRVPYMPEGMASADHFDTYWGALANPIDFTHAHPLQCNYPDGAPHVGDYLTVADPLPDPSPGTGRYYVTAATHQGTTRYGRKASAGQLSGRDPALLPACNTP